MAGTTCSRTAIPTSRSAASPRSVATSTRHFPPANEVQNVALRDFNTDGDSFTLTFEGTTSDPLVRGTNYDAASIEAEIESITGANVVIGGFGGSGAPDDTGFQVTFAGALADTDIASLSVTNPVSMSGFVGEKVQGGPVANRGNTIVDTGNHIPVVSTPSEYRIPVRTPFRLTGSATDADSDPITYLWEQNDIGGVNGTSLTNNIKRNGPLFRQFGTAALVSGDDTLESPSPGRTRPAPTRPGCSPTSPRSSPANTNAATGACPTGAPDPGRRRLLLRVPADGGLGRRPERPHAPLPPHRARRQPGCGRRLALRHGAEADPQRRAVPRHLAGGAETVAGGTQLTVKWDVANTDVASDRRPPGGDQALAQRRGDVPTVAPPGRRRMTASPG